MRAIYPIISAWSGYVHLIHAAILILPSPSIKAIRGKNDVTIMEGFMNIFEFRVALLRRGISQNRLARIIGLHPQNLSSIVNEDKNATAQVRKRIAKELNVSEKILFGNASAECKGE